MKAITKAELVNEFVNAKNGTFAAVTYVADVKMNKRGNPLANANVQKIVSRSVMIGCSYENMVNNRTDQDFTSAPLAWGKWLVPNKVIEHNGQLYFRLYPNGKADTTYYVNGKLATESEIAIIKQFTPDRQVSARQLAVGVNVEDVVRPIVVKVEGILGMSINKERLQVVAESAVAVAQ